MVVAVFALGGLPAGGLAVVLTAFRIGCVRVAPAVGSPSTMFVLSFKSPERTGVFGATQRHDLLTASAPNRSHGCITNVDVRAPDARKGHRVRVRLAPRRLGGHWCTGVYRGQVQEIESPVCPHHLLCPGFAILRGIVGRFTFRVKHIGPGPRDGSPPAFAGGEGYHNPTWSTPPGVHGRLTGDRETLVRARGDG